MRCRARAARASSRRSLSARGRAGRARLRATLDGILSEAVRLRLPADLPVATLFSGGIDRRWSRITRANTAPRRRATSSATRNRRTYRYAADYTATNRLRPAHGAVRSGERGSSAPIDEVVDVTEFFEPNLIRGAVCSLEASRRMHEDGFRVALCGEGADELFCGYPPLEIAFQTADEGRPIRDECLDLMHRVSLQRVDRCSMRHQVETREPFLDPAVVNYALGFDPPALVGEVGGLPRGKAALRDSTTSIRNCRRSIRDRAKVPFGEGAGLERARRIRPGSGASNEAISDAELRDGQRKFAAFNLQSKEELYYMRKLAQVMDVSRVPHLTDRAWISFPVTQNLEKLKAYAHFSL